MPKTNIWHGSLFADLQVVYWIPAVLTCYIWINLQVIVAFNYGCHVSTLGSGLRTRG